MKFEIAQRPIGGDAPVFIVAELSCNHQQDFSLAVKTIRAMKEAGADAVKLSTDWNDGGITIDCDNRYFRIGEGTIWDGKTLFELYEEAFTPWEWQPKLKSLIEELGMVCFSTATDTTAVDFLEGIDIPCYKIASFEINDLPLIEYAAAKGKPMIISTGVATLSDIEAAVHACRKAGNHRIALLKATSAYPTPFREINLRTIPHLRSLCGTVVGLSDHSLGTSVAVAAVALGAKVVEKHFILERALGGPDAAFSMEPQEFRQMVQSIREVEQALGAVSYEIPEGVRRNRRFMKSLFAIRDIAAGEEFTGENIRSIRPGDGLPPGFFPTLVGKKANRPIRRGTPLTWELLLGASTPERCEG